MKAFYIAADKQNAIKCSSQHILRIKHIFTTNTLSVNRKVLEKLYKVTLLSTCEILLLYGLMNEDYNI